jgi:ubiquinol-cytochrome c reductase cytochrome c1 subunit
MHKVKGVSLAVALIGLTLAGTGQAASSGGPAMPAANNDMSNIPSLQRGAANFMNYCSGCHSAQYVRFNSMGADLELSETQLIKNLMFNAEKTFETIRSNIPEDDSKRWFGVTPPDLSLMARSRGSDYIYNFLRGFYVDESRPTGVNNIMLEGTSMPHVLVNLQGLQKVVHHEAEGAKGSGAHEFAGFELVSAGSMSPEEFDNFVRDTVNFLDYISEPVQMKRRVIGVWTLIFLTLFLIVAYMLKKEIWKDVT